MPIIEALREGLHGVTLALPEPLEVVDNESSSANLVDRAQGVGWYVFMFPGVHLELGICSTRCRARTASITSHRHARR